jgi:hypothetical protein
MMQYGRLPCPASFIARPGDENYAREVVPLCADSDGKIYTPDGKATFAATGRQIPVQVPAKTPPINPDIIIGAVPVRDLGLSDTMRADAWGHLFTYAVSASVTAGMGNGAGVIDVVDETGQSVLPYPSGKSSPDKTGTGTALYVLVSHGKDGKGAYLANPGPAVTRPPLSCDSAPGLDTLNCSFELGNPASPFAFRNAPFSSQAGASWFDDTVAFYTPLGEDSPVCPASGNTSKQSEDACMKQLNGLISAQVKNLMQSSQSGTPPANAQPNNPAANPAAPSDEQMNDLMNKLQQLKEIMQNAQPPNGGPPPGNG